VRAVRSFEGVAKVVEQPEPDGEGIPVKVASAGICGSDLHLLGWDIPLVMGHELAGTLPDGTPVAVEPMDPCWACDPCLSGAYNLCVRGASMVFGVGRDGGMADICMTPPRSITRLPSGVNLADACLVEPLAVALHGIRRGGVEAGQRVAVIGGGSIGQLALVAALATGAWVALEARHDRQREVASELGAAEVSDGYDVVVEAAGTGSALARAVEICRPGGSVVLLGTYWDEAVMPGLAMGMKEVSLIPASMYARSGPSRDFDVAASLLAAQPSLPELLITHRFPLDAAAEAFAAARDRSAGAIKVVLET
jgi:2-desacetyl-2-hydroxyethyl bacteriochlorophyllide A dehydrogenase